MNDNITEDDTLPTCTQLEQAGYRTKAGLKKGEPDLVQIPELAAYVTVKNAIANCLIKKPLPRVNNFQFTI